jgi:hypothetical protein
MTPGRLAAAILVAAVAGGCGAGERKTTLDITVQLAPGTPAARRHFHIECDPPSGSVPDPAALCAALRSDSTLVLPPEMTATCAGGPGVPPDIDIAGLSVGRHVAVASLRSCDLPLPRSRAARRWLALLGLDR